MLWTCIMFRNFSLQKNRNNNAKNRCHNILPKWQWTHNLFTSIFSISEKVLLQWDEGCIKFGNLIRIYKVYIQIFIKKASIRRIFKKNDQFDSLLIALCLVNTFLLTELRRISRCLSEPPRFILILSISHQK